ncbi:MAG TPA: hypothetical protein VF789_33425 [Thermoanaerobaculia bacterium]
MRVSGSLRRTATASPPAPRSTVESRFERDFSQVPVHGPDRIFINGPDQPAPAPQTPPARAAANCPTDIQVARVDHPQDRDFGQKSPITGWGGIAVMEVSDPSGKDWSGTKIHENLRRVSNTCGDQGENACSNRSGAGSGAGSNFEVGKESNFLGLAKLPAARNRFHDLHVFADRGSSLLHKLNKPTCEVQCEQFFDCGGRRFGPDFVITYVMTQDSVPRQGGGSNAVTRVQIRKAVKTAQQGTP